MQERIKAKQEERKSLVAERKACSAFKVVTINALTKQITTLTEDIMPHACFHVPSNSHSQANALVRFAHSTADAVGGGKTRVET